MKCWISLQFVTIKILIPDIQNSGACCLIKSAISLWSLLVTIWQLIFFPCRTGVLAWLRLTSARHQTAVSLQRRALLALNLGPSAGRFSCLKLRWGLRCVSCVYGDTSLHQCSDSHFCFFTLWPGKKNCWAREHIFLGWYHQLWYDYILRIYHPVKMILLFKNQKCH